MSKRRIYYQHLHFKGRKQDTLSWYSHNPKSGPDRFKHAHICAHRCRCTNMPITYTHTHMHTVWCPSFSLSFKSFAIHLSPSIKGDLCRSSFRHLSSFLLLTSFSLLLFFSLLSFHTYSDRRPFKAAEWFLFEPKCSSLVCHYIYIMSCFLLLL